MRKNQREIKSEIGELRNNLLKYDRDLAQQSKLCAALMVYYDKAQEKAREIDNDLSNTQKQLDNLTQLYREKLRLSEIS